MKIKCRPKVVEIFLYLQLTVNKKKNEEKCLNKKKEISRNFFSNHGSSEL